MGWRDPFVEEVAGKELVIVATICTVLDDRIKRVGLTSELSLKNILLIFCWEHIPQMTKMSVIMQMRLL